MNRHARDGRMPAAVAVSAGFGVGLGLAAVFAIAGPAPLTGILALAAGCALLSWFSTVPGALGIGAVSWLFYSGFVVHNHGQLAVTGPRDAIVAAVLVGLALAAALLRAVLARRSVHLLESGIPLQRVSREDSLVRPHQRQPTNR